ncbi:F-box only protein 6-like isoform X3 [Equus quagga]|uniref:F-box only protein 6-like isoform X3 n=1 Tax=Equus quagga TaxID=89248 RepID=UPI001EE22F5D|nr:F-box only protein 6-like isoform X3 [Equus quagga]
MGVVTVPRGSFWGGGSTEKRPVRDSGPGPWEAQPVRGGSLGLEGTFPPRNAWRGPSPSAPPLDSQSQCVHRSPAMALASINELPENILLEVFTHVPARQLLLSCRPVCSLWRDLVDVSTLWKRKSLLKGFITEDWDQPVADWKIFFFLCSLRRNLLRNPCAEEGMASWQIISNGGDHWRVESLPGAHGTDFPDSRVKKYFVTSYDLCLKSQLVDLKAEGYWEELLDTFRPDIVVKDWFAARADCGCTYRIGVHLTSADYLTLASFEPPPVTIEQWNDARWTEVSHTFSDYPPGVRHILFQHGGQDTQFWAGWYGPRVTNSSIIISHKMTRTPAPSTAQLEATQG